MTRGDHPSRRQRSSQRRKNALAGIERNRARIFRVADGRFDAPCHRMRRLESWLVVIDAEHIAAKYMTLGLASVLLDAFVSYRLFPISELRSPHRRQFRSQRLVSRRRNRYFSIQRCFPILIQPNIGALRRQLALPIGFAGHPHKRNETPAADRMAALQRLTNTKKARSLCRGGPFGR